MANQDTAQYREFLENLEREDHRPGALNDIKNLILFKPAGEATTTIRDVGISKIVQCLNVQDKSHVDLTCEVLKICFEKFEVGDVVKNYTSHIMYLLRHEKSCVRKLAIEEVLKIVNADAALLPLPQYIDVFVAISQLVSDEDVGVANKAILITSNLPFEAYTKVLDEMKIALEYSTSSKCNAYEVGIYNIGSDGYIGRKSKVLSPTDVEKFLKEAPDSQYLATKVIINISLKSLELFNLCTDQGYIENMVSELQSNDVLFQLNILELLSRLAVKPHGINYLIKHGALQRITELIGDLQNNPLGGLILPGYIKFFGNIAHHYPREIFDKYPVLLDSLFNAIDSIDQAVLPVALDTLGFIATTIEGKLCLASLGSRYTQTVQKVGDIIKNSKTEIKVRALYCFSSLISIDKDPSIPQTGPVDHRVTLMTREWFRSISTQPAAMEILFDICKNPFPDIRFAAFSLLEAVCQHQWGQDLVARTAGFIEYLLDRTVDHTKELKEAKYDVIKKLSNSVSFDDNTVMILQTYVEQGAFYSETALQVAMDEGDD